ncbi:MAG: hypothetical protein RJA70_1116 [Pseudomonadota bacterium]
MTKSQAGSRVWFFGQWLIGAGAVSAEDVEAAASHMRARNLRLGDLAVAEGYLDARAAHAIHQAQRRSDRHFAELARELGYLSGEQVQRLLELQRLKNLRIGEALVDLGKLTAEELVSLLNKYEALTQTRAQSVAIPDSFRSVPGLVRLVDALPRTLLRSVQLQVKVGDWGKVKGSTRGLHSSCALVGPGGLMVWLAVEPAVGDAFARNALQMPDNEPVCAETVTETLQEVVAWLLETTADSVSDIGDVRMVGTHSSAMPSGVATELQLAFVHGAGKLLVSRSDADLD